MRDRGALPLAIALHTISGPPPAAAWKRNLNGSKPAGHIHSAMGGGLMSYSTGHFGQAGTAGREHLRQTRLRDHTD